MKPRAILFDLDGTLIDTAPDLAYALNFILSEDNLTQKPYEHIKPLVSFGAKALIEFGFGVDEKNLDFIDKHKKLLNVYEKNINKFSKPFNGIDKIISILRYQKISWGVVTNKPENLTHLLLNKLNIKPDIVVCGDSLEFNKPHPAPLLFACASLAISPKNTLFVGDDKNDMLAGKNAKIKTIAANYGYGKVTDDWGYDYLINHPLELKEWIL